MTDLPTGPGGWARLLHVLSAMPLRLVAGIAAGCWAIYLATQLGVGGLDLAPAFLGLVAVLAAVFFSALFVVSAVADVLLWSRAHLATVAERKRQRLRIMPRPRFCWWNNLAKQVNGTFITQFSLDIDVANLSDVDVSIVDLVLIKPRARAEFLLALDGSWLSRSDDESDARIRPSETVRLEVHGMIRGAYALPGCKLRVQLKLVDSFGVEYTSLVDVTPRGRREPGPPALPRRAAFWLRRVLRLPVAGLHPTPERQGPPQATPAAWNHAGAFETLDVVLREEQRSYRANGRQRGGLGSFKVRVGGEPNAGWTKVGDTPQLLVFQRPVVKLASINSDRIESLLQRMDAEMQGRAVEYLLSHLNRRSPYANVAYLIFIVLFRRGQGGEALKRARADLSGDSVHGYSNVLGLLSALLSHEHETLPDELLHNIVTNLSGDEEHDFRLREKIDLIRAIRIDKPFTGDVTTTWGLRPGDSQAT